MTDTVTRYDPPSGLTRLSDAFEHLVRESFVLPSLLDRLGDGFSSITSNINEVDNSYVIQMALPGIDPAKVDIRVVGHQMTIKGTYEIPPVTGATTLRKGLMAGEFSEVVSVPAEVDGDNAEAAYKNGILTVTLPKAAQAEPKAIKVQIA